MRVVDTGIVCVGGGVTSPAGCTTGSRSTTFKVCVSFGGGVGWGGGGRGCERGLRGGHCALQLVRHCLQVLHDRFDDSRSSKQCVCLTRILLNGRGGAVRIAPGSASPVELPCVTCLSKAKLQKPNFTGLVGGDCGGGDAVRIAAGSASPADLPCVMCSLKLHPSTSTARRTSSPGLPYIQGGGLLRGGEVRIAAGSASPAELPACRVYLCGIHRQALHVCMCTRQSCPATGAWVLTSARCKTPLLGGTCLRDCELGTPRQRQCLSLCVCMCTRQSCPATGAWALTSTRCRTPLLGSPCLHDCGVNRNESVCVVQSVPTTTGGHSVHACAPGGAVLLEMLFKWRLLPALNAGLLCRVPPTDTDCVLVNLPRQCQCLLAPP
jgi:hypothetical protein